MASPAYEQILAIQGLDLNLTQLRHRHATHPLRDEISGAESQAQEVGQRIAEIEQRKHEADRNLKRLSDEVEMIEAKRTDIDTKLYNGSVTASKDLLALQDEAASMLTRQTGIEDEELEIMELLESVGEELAAAENKLAAIEQSRQQADERLRATTAELDVEIAEVAAQRDEAAKLGMPDLVGRYEELAAQFGGVAVARLTDGRCDGCHMQLSAMAVDRLSKAPEDAVVTCEECGRLLVR